MKYYLLLFFSFPLLCLHAQAFLQHQHVHLAGGSFLRVSDIDTLNGETLQVTLAKDGSLIAVPLSAVKHIGQEKQKQLLLPNGKTVIAKGWYHQLRLQFLTGELEWDLGNRTNFGFTYSTGKYLLPSLAVGAGLSVDFYEHLMVPVFVEGRYYAPARATIPYLSLQVGYGIAAEKIINQDPFEHTRGSLVWHPELGLRFATRRRADIQLSVGYKFQHYITEYDYPREVSFYTNYKERRQFRSLTMGMSFIF